MEHRVELLRTKKNGTRELKEMLHMESGIWVHSSLPLRLWAALVVLRAQTTCSMWVMPPRVVRNALHSHNSSVDAYYRNKTVDLDQEKVTVQLFLMPLLQENIKKKYAYKME